LPEKEEEEDVRECVTCKILGDHEICGRLLPFETNWIHINCLLWSNEVVTEGHIIKQIQQVLNKSKNTVKINYNFYIEILISNITIILVVYTLRKTRGDNIVHIQKLSLKFPFELRLFVRV